MSTALPAFDPRPLIAEVDRELEALLPELAPADWQRTAVKAWRVRDVVAHLIDGNLRRLALDRDAWRIPGAPPITGFAALTAWLDELNAEWTVAARRLSPALLTQLTVWTNAKVRAYFATLELDAKATFAVSWAGEERSAVWMDLARELTEKWLHQQQVRDAVGRPGLTEEHFLAPVLDTFARALPRAYAAVEARPGTAVRIEVTDAAPCRWRLVAGAGGWSLSRAAQNTAEPADATIRVSADTAWRLFVKGLDGKAARARATIAGPDELTEPFFATLAIMG